MISMDNITQQVFDVIEGRKHNAPEGSYTAKLFAAGEVEVLKKIGEEAVAAALFEVPADYKQVAGPGGGIGG